MAAGRGTFVEIKKSDANKDKVAKIFRFPLRFPLRFHTVAALNRTHDST
jgi:hypothetical protein